LLALLGATAAVSLVVRAVVYPAMSWNRDEATYLWQVRALRAGQLLTTTLGWPGLMLVADVLFGSSAAAIVWGTLLAVLGTYVFARELTRDRTLALVTAALMLA